MQYKLGKSHPVNLNCNSKSTEEICKIKILFYFIDLTVIKIAQVYVFIISVKCFSQIQTLSKLEMTPSNL